MERQLGSVIGKRRFEETPEPLRFFETPLNGGTMLDFWITAFISILFLVDPPGTIPAYLALTANYPPARRKKTAFVACLTATITLGVFAAIGNYLFGYLHLTLPAFQIAGGLVLFLVALDMIRAKTTQEDPNEIKDGHESQDVAITPLAVPFLAGPAALSTVAILMSQAEGDAGKVSTVFLAITLTGAISYITLRLAEPIRKRLGMTGIHVLGRVLGLVLAGIAVQFVLDGLAAAKIIAPIAQ